MRKYTLTIIIAVTVLITACGGGSSGTPASGTTGGEQTTGSTTSATAGDTDGADTGGDNIGSENMAGGGAGSLADIVGVWNMTSTGSVGREEYWDIQDDGTFNAYIFRDFKQLYLPAAMDNLDVIRCFEHQVNSIASSGGNVYTVEGLFADERYGNNTYEFSRNTDGTLQAKFPLDILMCGENGCSTQINDLAYPPAAADFSANELPLCPSVIASHETLITSPTDSGENTYWECSFVNQDDKTAPASMANITVNGDGGGSVKVGDVVRELNWFSRRGSDLIADYIDGSGTFELVNLIFYSVNDTNDRFTALDVSTRVNAEGLATTYFDMDCSKQVGDI